MKRVSEGNSRQSFFILKNGGTNMRSCCQLLSSTDEHVHVHTIGGKLCGVYVYIYSVHCWSTKTID